jgi:hypothetical protein
MVKTWMLSGYPGCPVTWGQPVPVTKLDTFILALSYSCLLYRYNRVLCESKARLYLFPAMTHLHPCHKIMSQAVEKQNLVVDLFGND